MIGRSRSSLRSRDGRGPELVAVLAVVALEPARADAEHEATVADVVDGARHVGEQVRIAVRVARDERAELRVTSSRPPSPRATCTPRSARRRGRRRAGRSGPRPRCCRPRARRRHFHAARSCSTVVACGCSCTPTLNFEPCDRRYPRLPILQLDPAPAVAQARSRHRRASSRCNRLADEIGSPARREPARTTVQHLRELGAGREQRGVEIELGRTLGQPRADDRHRRAPATDRSDPTRAAAAPSPGARGRP